MRTIVSLVFVLVLVISTQAQEMPASKLAPVAGDGKPNWPVQQLQRGRQLFLQNCAVCHGFHGEGAPDWTRRDAQGKLPAPPLNGTGHAWHHPKQALVYTIKNGTLALGGSMPPWKDKLSDDDINAIIAWFQSHWPEEIYAAWQKLDRQAR